MSDPQGMFFLLSIIKKLWNDTEAQLLSGGYFMPAVLDVTDGLLSLTSQHRQERRGSETLVYVSTLLTSLIISLFNRELESG